MAMTAKKSKKKTEPKAPRLMSWVKLGEWAAENDKQYGYTKTLGEGPYIYFGEIPNMPGHCVVLNRQNKFTIGMHIFNFVELTSEET